MNLILTSAGFETKSLENLFIKTVNKKMSSVKALFIPTAAIDADAIEVLPKCLNDLLKCGVKRENITVYDLHKSIKADEYDVIYICGGNTEYLLGRINEIGFDREIHHFLSSGKIIVGVSAGSIIFADNLKNNLGVLKCDLDVHCSKIRSTKSGLINTSKVKSINLSDKQAVIFKEDDTVYVIE